jgi:hypothetical protein
MVQRRTGALAQLGIAVIGSFVQICLWRQLLDDGEEWDEPTHPSAYGLAAGALYRSADRWIHDRDVGEVRTNPYRGVLFGIRETRSERQLVPQDEEFQDNFGIGKTVGMVGYRLWYGLLRPLPGPDE